MLPLLNPGKMFYTIKPVKTVLEFGWNSSNFTFLSMQAESKWSVSIFVSDLVINMIAEPLLMYRL